MSQWQLEMKPAVVDAFVNKQNDARYREYLQDGRSSPKRLSVASNTLVAKRVHWFRCSAMVARWREEVRLLREESR